VTPAHDRRRDAAAVSAALAGDERALAALVARWQPSLLRHAARLLSDREAAKDAVQEAWLDIMRGLDRLDDRSLFGVWAFRILTRKCQRALRGRYAQAAAREALASEALVAEQTAPRPGARTEAALDAERIGLALKSLPPGQLVVMELHYLDGFTVAEIAVSLSLPAGTVKTRLMHARRKVRALLEGEPV
jgi:RNA polymerase sigma factor (sigma-70 family)